MKSRNKLTPNEKALIRRYLIWCYKTTKEELDRIDRKFTQLIVDEFILKTLQKSQKRRKNSHRSALLKQIRHFKLYIEQKQKSACQEMFKGSTNTINPQYQYLKSRFAAVERAICKFFSPKELNVIRDTYEKEMTRRIVESKEHS